LFVSHGDKTPAGAGWAHLEMFFHEGSPERRLKIEEETTLSE
jgi:hypothetical protein